jgi:hypothetical protein
MWWPLPWISSFLANYAGNVAAAQHWRASTVIIALVIGIVLGGAWLVRWHRNRVRAGESGVEGHHLVAAGVVATVTILSTTFMWLQWGQPSPDEITAGVRAELTTTQQELKKTQERLDGVQATLKNIQDRLTEFRPVMAPGVARGAFGAVDSQNVIISHNYLHDSSCSGSFGAFGSKDVLISDNKAECQDPQLKPLPIENGVQYFKLSNLEIKQQTLAFADDLVKFEAKYRESPSTDASMIKEYHEIMLPKALALRSDIRLRNATALRLPPQNSPAFRGRIMLQDGSAMGKLSDLAEYMRFLYDQVK